MHICQWSSLLPNYYASLILDNIFILFLKNILADPLVQYMYPVLNPWYLWNQYKYKILFLLWIFRDKYRGHILCESELKFRSHHDTAFLLLK